MRHGATTDPFAHRAEFFLRCPGVWEPLDLVGRLPGVGVYAKDRESRYVFSNEDHRERYGRIREEDLLGKRASDFFPPLLGAAYEANDRIVFDTGEPLVNEIWLVPTIRGTPNWFLSSKTPLRSPGGDVVGLMGVLYPIDTPEDQKAHFGSLWPVIEHVSRHFDDEITTPRMAELADLSVPQFNRRFRRLLRITPLEYVQSIRIQEAQRLLSTTRQSVGEIASATGFYDQSHFTKRFRKVTGITPLDYRRKYL